MCLTVVERDANSFDVTASAETLAVTTAGDWMVGDQINLECIELGDELGGHIVSGHVDGLAEIKSIESSGDSHVVWASSPICLCPVYCGQRFGCFRWGIVDGERCRWVFIFYQHHPAYLVINWVGSGRYWSENEYRNRHAGTLCWQLANFK